MHRSSTARLAALIGVVLAASAGLAPAAVASTPTARSGPTCGAVLTSDTTLTRDLVCRNGTALTIAADLRLDLGGHRIVGPGASSGARGVVLTEDALDVTITNGTVRGWGNAIIGTGGPDGGYLALSRLRLVKNEVALPVAIASSVDITDSTFLDNEYGMFYQSANVTVARSVFSGNRTGGYAAVSGHLTITRTTFVNNAEGLVCDEVFCHLANLNVRANGTGIRNRWATVNLTASTVARNELGVFLQFGSNGTLEANTFRDNTVGVEASWTDRTVVRGNVFRGNGTGFLSRYIEDGINQASTVVESNTFSRNGDGIHSTQPGVQIGRNVAANNTGWGIYAQDAVDLGGNVARRNGNEPQCVGVVCTPRS